MQIRRPGTFDMGGGASFRLAGLLALVVALGGCSASRSPDLPPSPESRVVATGSGVAPKALDGIPSGAPEQLVESLPDEHNIFFLSRSTTVDEVGKEKLRRIAERLVANPREKISLVGYTDDQGSRNYNLAITEERLLVVEKLLKSYRVPARQIRRKRIGGLKSSTTCQSAECRKQMRRVEVVFSR